MDWPYCEDDRQILTTNNSDVDFTQYKNKSMGQSKETHRRERYKKTANKGLTCEMA